MGHDLSVYHDVDISGYLHTLLTLLHIVQGSLPSCAFFSLVWLIDLTIFSSDPIEEEARWGD